MASDEDAERLPDGILPTDALTITFYDKAVNSGS